MPKKKKESRSVSGSSLRQTILDGKASLNEQILYDDDEAASSNEGDSSGNENENVTSSSHASQCSDSVQDTSLLAENLQENFCAPGVRENAPTNITVFRPVSNQDLQRPLNHAAMPFAPGTVDAIINACGGQIGSRPATNLLPENSARTQIGNNIKAHATAGHFPRPNDKPMQLPRVWSKISPAVFPSHEEPPDSYKINGVISVDVEEAADITAEYENVLVGRVVGKNFQFEWLVDQLHTKWGAYKGFRVVDLGVGCFMLFFESRKSRDEVWLGGPWHVAGCLVGLDQWTGKFIPSMNPEMLVPTWIRASGLPLHFWGEKTLRRIAAEVGEPLFIDALTKSRERPSYARFCVRRNLAKPLVGGVWLHSESTGNFFQKLAYEEIASLCTTCGLAGHGDGICNVKPANGVGNGAEVGNPLPGLDNWTLVEPKRPPPKSFRYPNYKIPQQHVGFVWQQKHPPRQNQVNQDGPKMPANDLRNEIYHEPNVVKHNTNTPPANDSNSQLANNIMPPPAIDNSPFPGNNLMSLPPANASAPPPEMTMNTRQAGHDSDDNTHATPTGSPKSMHGECSTAKPVKAKKTAINYDKKEKTAEDYLEDCEPIHDDRRGRSRSRQARKCTNSEGETDATKKKKKKSKSRPRAEQHSADDAGETSAHL